MEACIEMYGACSWQKIVAYDRLNGDGCICGTTTTKVIFTFYATHTHTLALCHVEKPLR